MRNVVKVLPLLFVLISSVQAKEFREDPNKMFDMKKSMTTLVTVSIEYTNNVQGRCEKESSSRNLGKFGYAVEACSFWRKVAMFDTCHIIVPKRASLITIGHEFAHCLFGNWH